MIENTFLFLDGIGKKLERKLWQRDILTWDDFLERDSVPFISSARKKLMDGALFFASLELKNENTSYFKDALESSEHWRLFGRFKTKAVCLDIETNGLSPDSGGYPTAVGIYDGHEYKCLLWGNGLSADALMEELSKYKILITFFGSSFDIPFLEASLRGFRLEIPHFDLFFGAKRLGLSGGLKKLEPIFGIKRPKETQGLNGYDAVLLWRESRLGSREALELLKLYNREDTVNLMQIAQPIYEGLKAKSGLEESKKKTEIQIG